MKFFFEVKLSVFKSSVINITIFLSILIGITLIINLIFPYPNLPNYGDEFSFKYHFFATHKDEYNAIFLGPSSTLRGISPKEFDELMQNRGYEIQSFNLGISGLAPAEMDFYLDKILLLKPTNLKWIFIDYDDVISLHNIKVNASSMRNIYWHSLKETLLTSRLIIEESTPGKNSWLYKLETLYSNLKSFLLHTFKIGRLSSLWKHAILQSETSLSSESNEFDKDLLVREQGFYPLNKKNLKQLGNYTRLLQEYQKKLPLAPLKPFSSQVVERIQNKISSQGIQPIFLIMPIVHNSLSPTITQLNKQEKLELLFDFSDPNMFPELYRVDHRADSFHLNEQGARALTDSLADLFAHYLDADEEN